METVWRKVSRKLLAKKR